MARDVLLHEVWGYNAGVTTHTRVGEGPVPEAIQTAVFDGCDLLVMSTHGRSGLKRLLIGSVAADIIQHTHVPVLLLQNNAILTTGATITQAFDRLEVADFSARAVIDTIGRFAHLSTQITLTHLNHTNPALIPGTEARTTVEDAGCRVAEEGERFGL